MRSVETKFARGIRIMKNNREVHRLHLSGKHLEANQLLKEMIK